VLLASNNLIEIDRTVREFRDIRIEKLLSDLARDLEANEPKFVVPMAYFPLQSVLRLPDDLINQSTESGYVDTWGLEVLSKSRDLEKIMDDLQRQFEATLAMNKELTFLLSNKIDEKDREAALRHSRGLISSLRQQITDYAIVLERDFFGKNVPIYLKSLATTLAVIDEYNRIGYMSWKWKFRIGFKCYRNKESYLHAKANIMKKIDLYLKEKVDAKIASTLELLTQSQSTSVVVRQES
jgi:hypothetical protein